MRLDLASMIIADNCYLELATCYLLAKWYLIVDTASIKKQEASSKSGQAAIHKQQVATLK